MTPQKKAKESVDKFIAHAYHNNSEIQCKDHAKECSLIAVDEIIKELNEWGEVWMKRRLDFWQEVKQEIKKI